MESTVSIVLQNVNRKSWIFHITWKVHEKGVSSMPELKVFKTTRSKQGCGSGFGGYVISILSPGSGSFLSISDLKKFKKKVLYIF